MDHRHSCTFCGGIYECAAAHELPQELLTREGGRCCRRCREWTLQALDNLEAKRRRYLYE